jgi:hypothetical protein
VVTLPSSLHEARAAFAAAPPVSLGQLVGVHRAQFVGPAWWLRSGPLLTGLGGMRRWWGKHFWPAGEQEGEPGGEQTGTPAGSLDGQNLLDRGGRLVPSYPMSARVQPSRFDGRPALVVRYPPPAPLLWQQVTDELRPLDGHPGVLVGLTVTSVPVLTAGMPFLLHRVDVTPAPPPG